MDNEERKDIEIDDIDRELEEEIIKRKKIIRTIAIIIIITFTFFIFRPLLHSLNLP